MRIIKDTVHPDKPNLEYPDIFATEVEKGKDRYVKGLMDYFASYAHSNFEENIKTFVKNYKLFKGILTKEDFYDKPEVVGFMQELEDSLKDETLPPYVQQYSIINQPINMLLGENSKRPDNIFIKCFDADSQSEEFQYITDLLLQYARQNIQNKFIMKFVQQGIQPDMEQIQQMTEEEISEKMSNYTSMVERWSNRVVEALKMELSTKEKLDECFSDLIKAGMEFIEIFERPSSLGLDARVINPKNFFALNKKDKKYVKECTAAGHIRMLDISEIISEFNLTKEEVDVLRNKNKERVPGTKTGMYSVEYDTISLYDKYVRPFEDAVLRDELSEQLGFTERTVNPYYGDKYGVIVVYYKGKIKIGKLTYIDEEGIQQVEYVDENYKSGMHPQEISLEWGYKEQIYKGVKIGEYLYDHSPIDFTDRIPIAGGFFDNKNSDVKSFLDLMKPYQAIYNLVMNQLWELLNKEKGVLMAMNPRKIPVETDEPFEDALDLWMERAKATGIAFEDDTIENMKVISTNNTNLSRPLDLTRTNEMQSRLNIAQQIKRECWELVGITPERMGSTVASQTATSIQVATSQSYSQTEPWFTFHECVMNDFYQLLLDTAQYFESQKPESNISYISAEGERMAIRIVGNQLKNRDIRLFATSRAEDNENLRNLRGLAQAMMQNGVSAYEIAKINSSKSIRAIEDVLLRVRKMQEDFRNRELQNQEQQTQAIQQQTQMLAQQAEQKRVDDNMNKALDRESKERIAAMQTFARQDNNLIDSDGDGTPDIYELLKNQTEQDKIQNDYDIKNQQLEQTRQVNALKLQEQMEKNRLVIMQAELDREEKEKDRKLKREEMANNWKIALKNKN